MDESESRWVASAGHSNVFSSLIRDVLASVRGADWGANSKCLIRLYNRAVGKVWDGGGGGEAVHFFCITHFHFTMILFGI